MEPEASLPHSQQPDTCPCSEPDKSSSPFPHPIHLRYIFILSSLLHLGLPSGLFPLWLPAKSLYALLLSPIRATYPACLNRLFTNFYNTYGKAHVPDSDNVNSAHQAAWGQKTRFISEFLSNILCTFIKFLYCSKCIFISVKHTCRIPKLISALNVGTSDADSGVPIGLIDMRMFSSFRKFT